MREIRPLLRGCYQRALIKDQSLSGVVRVKFSIVADDENGGLVESSEILESGDNADTIRSLQEKLRTRILRYLERHGCLDPVDVDDMLAWDHEGGFSLDGSVHIEDWDRNALERLTRYCARPPFSSGRLGQLDENTVAYNLPRPTPDGRTCLFIPSQLCKPRYISVSFW